MSLLNCLPIEVLFEIYFVLDFEDILEVRRACKYLTISSNDQFWNEWATKSTTNTAKHFRENKEHQSIISIFKELKKIGHYTRKCLHIPYTTSVPLVSDFIFQQLETSPVGRRFTSVLNLTHHLNKKQFQTFKILLENAILWKKFPNMKNYENIAVLNYSTTCTNNFLLYNG